MGDASPLCFLGCFGLGLCGRGMKAISASRTACCIGSFVAPSNVMALMTVRLGRTYADVTDTIREFMRRGVVIPKRSKSKIVGCCRPYRRNV
jgi:hypothetical protein